MYHVPKEGEGFHHFLLCFSHILKDNRRKGEKLKAEEMRVRRKEGKEKG